jgi:crotonobetainyl-CoA:carnitine CoA-transferase CaiB-like acyl-CoA transferase
MLMAILIAQADLYTTRSNAYRNGSAMSNALLDQLLALVDETPSGNDVQIVGNDPVLPTTFPIGEAGAACIAAAALEAARLCTDRTGRSQDIRVEVDAAAAAMRSSRYIRAADAPGRRTAGGGLGLYRTSDERWMYFQRLFPHHRERIFGVLGCDEDEEAITAAVRQWQGLALEEAVIAAGASGGMVRTANEWRDHPQARALAELPLLEVERIADSEAQPLPPSERPLGGVRVLDLTRVLAGPTSARTLAEHGAEVLRVGTAALPDNETMMRDTGHGKRSTALDLRSAEDVQALNRLLADTDVFVQGYRPGALAALGFSVEEVAKKRPGIVYVSISAFGYTGPWRGRRGFDSVVQAVSGLADANAVDGRPRFLPANPLDYMTGYLAAFGAMVALRRRQTEGGSYRVRLSLAQTGRWLAGLPRVDAALAAARPGDLPAERLDVLMMVSETPFGRLRHLKPAAQMTVTPPLWERPSVPLDHDRPEWASVTTSSG